MAGMSRPRPEPLSAFRQDVLDGAFPGAAETATVDERELEAFVERLERGA